MLAGTSATLFSVALQEWLDSDDDRTLTSIMLDRMQALRAALGHVPGLPGCYVVAVTPSRRGKRAYPGGFS
jgi:hypothetical protein